jgi:hypothetical protein
MVDLLFVLITMAFFVACVGYVRVCDRIIGPDPSTGTGDVDSAGVREEVDA